MDAAKAMPIGSAPANPSVSPSGVRLARKTATAIGIMMSEVAVLETIMEMRAVATINAMRSEPAVLPPRAKMASAKRR